MKQTKRKRKKAMRKMNGFENKVDRLLSKINPPVLMAEAMLNLKSRRAK